MGSCSLENRRFGPSYWSERQVQMSLVKYQQYGRHWLGLLGARWFAFLARRNWFGIRPPFIVVVLEAVHLSLISLARSNIPHDEQSRGRLAGDHGVPLDALIPVIRTYTPWKGLAWFGHRGSNKSGNHRYFLRYRANSQIFLLRMANCSHCRDIEWAGRIGIAAMGNIGCDSSAELVGVIPFGKCLLDKMLCISHRYLAAWYHAASGAPVRSRRTCTCSLMYRMALDSTGFCCWL
jgi:hypothetical protein